MFKKFKSLFKKSINKNSFSKKDFDDIEHFFIEIDMDIVYSAGRPLNPIEQIARSLFMLGIIYGVKHEWSKAQESVTKAYYIFKDNKNFKYMYASTLFLNTIVVMINRSLYPVEEMEDSLVFFTEHEYIISMELQSLYMRRNCTSKMIELSSYNYENMDMKSLLYLVFEKIFDSNYECLS